MTKNVSGTSGSLEQAVARALRPQERLTSGDLVAVANKLARINEYPSVEECARDIVGDVLEAIDAPARVAAMIETLKQEYRKALRAPVDPALDSTGIRLVLTGKGFEDTALRALSPQEPKK